jgi:hypothetical protein
MSARTTHTAACQRREKKKKKKKKKKCYSLALRDPAKFSSHSVCKTPLHHFDPDNTGSAVDSRWAVQGRNARLCSLDRRQVQLKTEQTSVKNQLYMYIICVSQATQKAPRMSTYTKIPLTRASSAKILPLATGQELLLHLHTQVQKAEAAEALALKDAPQR